MHDKFGVIMGCHLASQLFKIPYLIILIIILIPLIIILMIVIPLIIIWSIILEGSDEILRRWSDATWEICCGS